MALRKLYVIARGLSGRPTCMHLLVDGTSSETRCGLDISQWSRSFLKTPIEAVLCKRDACRA